MNILQRKYIIFMHRHFKRYRLRKICKALDIVPYPWQRDFALGKTDTLNAPEGRATGKTMAVILRLLMGYTKDHSRIVQILQKDPDFTLTNSHRLLWYDAEYKRQYWACTRENIPALYMDIYPLHRVGRPIMPSPPIMRK